MLLECNWLKIKVLCYALLLCFMLFVIADLALEIEIAMHIICIDMT